MAFTNIIKPVYLKNSEIQNDRNDRIKDFEIAEKLSIKVNDIKCTQLDRDLWRIYGGSQASRSTLVTGGFELRERNIQVYADNPFSTAIGNPNENVLKVTVKGVPLSVEDSTVRHMLELFNVTLCSDIKYEKVLNPTTHRMTEILNGNRFLYIKPLKEGEYLPCTCTCAGITCSLYYKGQPSPKAYSKYTKCWSTGHFTYQCEGDKC